MPRRDVSAGLVDVSAGPLSVLGRPFQLSDAAVGFWTSLPALRRLCRPSDASVGHQMMSLPAPWTSLPALLDVFVCLLDVSIGSQTRLSTLRHHCRPSGASVDPKRLSVLRRGTMPLAPLSAQDSQSVLRRLGLSRCGCRSRPCNCLIFYHECSVLIIFR